MSDKTFNETSIDEEAEADIRFQDALLRMMNTPHQPHEKKGREPKPAPESDD